MSNPLIGKLEAALLACVTVTDTSTPKYTVFDGTKIQQGQGCLLLSVSKFQQIDGLPDYNLTATLTGMTFLSQDPDKAACQQLAQDAMHSVQAWTPQTLTAALRQQGLAEPLVLGIQPSASMDLSSNDKLHTFAVQINLVIANLNF